MSFYDLLLIPILFGLVGFFEPCSLGANIILLNRIHQFGRAKRIYETLVFTFVRGFFLALVGLTAAFIGRRFIMIQSSLFIILGSIYILMGIIFLIDMYYPLFKVDVNIGKYFKNSASLGAVFGLIIPACAIAFVLALVGKAVLVDNLFQGFISLFIFGITLSAPLIAIGYFEKSNQIIKKIYAKVKNLKWLAGFVLIIVGILTILSSVWWAGALG